MAITTTITRSRRRRAKQGPKVAGRLRSELDGLATEAGYALRLSRHGGFLSAQARTRKERWYERDTDVETQYRAR